MNDPQRAFPIPASQLEARRNDPAPGPVIDTFVLPCSKVRPSLFFYVKTGAVWLTWAAVAVLVVVFVLYPRQSLITALTGVKLVNESFHEAFDPPHKMARETTPGQEAQAPGGGSAPKGGSPVASASGKNDPPGSPAKAGGSKGTATTPGAPPPPAVASAQATGDPLVINTPTNSEPPAAPKLALNLIIPGGSSSQPVSVAPPQPQGPAPSAIIINNNGSGAGGGPPPSMGVTITQAGGGAPPGPMTIQAGAGGGGNQPPPRVIVNGPLQQPGTVALEGGGGNGRKGQGFSIEQEGRTPGGNGISTEEGGGTGGGASSDNTSSPPSAGGAPVALHRNASGALVMPPDWPRQVAVQGTPSVTPLERSAGGRREFAAMTEHYEFDSDIKVGDDVLRELARVFEATYELNKLLPLRLHPTPENNRPRFIARLFSSDRDYFAAGGMQGSSGTYSRDQARILVPISSMGVKLVNGRMQTERTERTETLIHEITHQMMNKWLPLLPRWYAEGSADYIAMADYVHGRFFLNQMEDRLRRYLRRRGQQGDTFIMLRPADLMALDGKTWGMALASNAGSASQNYASATLLTFYFYHLDGNGDGANLMAYLRDIERGTAEPESAARHLLRGRSMDDLEQDVVKAFDQRSLKVRTTGRTVAKE